MDFRMAAREGKPGRTVVVSRWLINPTCGTRVEKTGVIDAIRMLVEIDSSLGRTQKGEVGRFPDVFVD